MYDNMYKIVMFGEADSGKTELLEKYAENFFDGENKLTIGVEFAVKNIEINGTYVKFQIFDLSSEERFRFLIPNYLVGVFGAFLIIKVYDDLQLSELRQKVLSTRTALSLVKNGSTPIVVLGIQDDLAVKQPKYQSENSVIAKIIGVDIFRVCRIKDKEDIESVFQDLCHILLKKSLAENRKISYETDGLPGSRSRVAPEGSSILFDRIVGFGLVIMVIVITIVSLYIAYLRNH